MKIIATYEMIRGYRNRATNTWLAISEFIDNSIASYTKNERNNSVNGLEVNIIFDYRNHNNRKLIIRDNANGMNASTLEQAMQPNYRQGKSDTQYNQYGVGMKLGIFWYGENVTIYSKEKGNEEYYIELNTHNADSSIAVEVQSNISDAKKVKTESGTIVEISYLYDNRCVIKPSAEKYETFINALGCRYSKLLGNMKITVTVLEESGEEHNVIIEPYIVQPFSLNHLFDKKIVKNLNNNNQWENIKKMRETSLQSSIEQLEKELQSEKKKNFSGKVLDCETIFEEAFQKFINDEEILLERTIIVNDKETQLHFGIQTPYNERTLSSECPKSKKLSRYSGVTVFHLDRAILHAPNTTDNNSSNVQFLQKELGSGGDPLWRRLYGYVDLTGIETPDENKSRFDWSVNGEQDLKNALYDIFKQLEPICQAIVSIENKKPAEVNSEKDYKQIKSSLSKSVKDSFFKIDKQIVINNENALQIKCMNIDNQEYKILVFEDLNSEEFLDWRKDDITNTIEVHIAADNPLWKPFISNPEFKGELLYPLVLILSIGQLVFNDTEWLEKYDIEENSKFIDIINNLIKDIII